MKRTAWFRNWFGDEYLALYPHRDLEEARLAVDLLLRTTGDEPGTRVLDLACGAGRHLVELVAAGLSATGLDLSVPMLEAAHRMDPGLSLVRGDMRALPFAPATFGTVTNFFTSFGYFRDEGDDRRVLSEVRRVLAPGGHVLLDFLNAHRVRAGLTPRDERTVDGARVIQTRELVDEGRVVEKRITIQGGGEPPRTFLERVRLYPPEDLRAMLRGTGLEPLSTFGDYHGAAFSRESPRFIVMGRAL